MKMVTKTSWAVRQNVPRNAKTLKRPPETSVILIVPQLIKVSTITSEISLRSIPETSVTPQKSNRELALEGPSDIL